jgi:hypothetical protein
METTDSSTELETGLSAREPEPISIRKLDRLQTTGFISPENQG